MPPAPARRASVRDRLIVLGYRAGWGVLRVLPGWLVAAAFRLGADVAYRRGGKGTARLRANLRRVLGPDASEAELDAVTRAGMRSYARYWLEVFRLSVIDRDDIVARMDIPAEHLLWEAMERGRGLVIALPHAGNWDHAGAFLVLRGIPFTTVAERLEPAEVFDRFLEFRTSLGMEVLPLTGGESPPFRTLADRLRAGGALCLLSDRDLSRHGVPVQFFGAQATMPAGPARLALDTGATLVAAVLSFRDDGWRADVYPPVPHTDVATMTQRLADDFADGIARHPEDWHMLQRLWTADLEPRAPRGAAGHHLPGTEPVAPPPGV